MDKFVGKILDKRYEIKEIIGVGGMAVVYKAYDNIDDRTVAVKILREEFLNNEDFCRRFKNESKAIAVLSHPNIVKVFDVSFGDRMQYIVMEYIDGISLKEYIEQQKEIKWKEAVYFVVQILRALQHAHDKGIVHRDIKPQNIMLIQDGTIKVTDFGIARFSRSEQRTVTDKAIGSVHYIAPEQARGDITDEKADIYSVGVMLYEMLTGRLPFEAETAVSVAIMQLQSQPRMPREINDTIPEGLEEITIKAMQKDSGIRYQSAAEMLRDIDEFKKNPSIKFEYKYFVEEPTKYVDAVNKVTAEDEDEEETEEKSHLIPILAGVTIALVVGAIVIAVIAILGGGLIGGGKGEIDVPNFVGQTYTEVLDKYGKDFKFKVISENSKDIPANVIISQKTKEGNRVKKQSEIEITLSLGPKIVVLNDVDGDEISIAISNITAQGFTYTLREVFDNEDIPKDFVIRTDPPRLSEVPEGSEIIIFVSKYDPKAKMVAVPSVLLLDEAGAKSLLTGKGFVVEVKREQATDSTRAGLIFKQSPEAPTQVPEGTQVTIYISTGPSVVVSSEPTQTLKKRTIEMELPHASASNFDIKLSSGESIPSKVYLMVMIDGKLYKKDIKIDPTSAFRIFSIEDVEGSGKKSVAVYVSDTPGIFDTNSSPYYINVVDFSSSGAVSDYGATYTKNSFPVKTDTSPAP